MNYGSSRFLLRTIVGLSLLAFFAAPPAFGQDALTATGSGGGVEAQINDFSRPGQATILVNVWGNAGAPGIWRVERTVDLIDFLSVVKVPGIGGAEPGMRSRTYVAIYRTQGSRRQEVYRTQVKDLLAEGARYPTLQNNDVLAIEVETRRKVSLRFVSTLIGTASSLTLLVLRFTQ